MKRTKHIVNILTAAVTLLLTASCNVSYPDLDLPQGEPPTNDEDVNIDKTSILLYTSNPAYFSVVSDTRGSVGTRGTGAFEPMETVAYNRDKYLNAKFHIFAFRAYNDADPNGGQGVLTEAPSMSRYCYAENASGDNKDEHNTSCLLDGPDYKLGMPFKFEPDQFIGTMNVLTKDYPKDIYYSSRYQDVGYNFFGYFVDDLDLSNYKREQNKISYDIEIDGYQDVLVGAAKTPLTEADFAEGGIYEKAASLTEDEKQKILNIPGNYSTFAAHRNVHPVVNMKHQLTKPLEQKATIKMDGVKAFEPGKSYKVTITVYGLQEIEVTATLVPWADGGSIDIDDDRNPNEGEYTEPTPATPEPIEP